MFYREKSKEKMKNYLYYNSIAAHPYYLIGNCFQDQRSEGLCKLPILDIYNNMNNLMKNLGEILT
jgi:hypothetical protein